MDQMNRLRQSKICDRGMGRELIISNLNPVIIKTQQHLRQQKSLATIETSLPSISLIKLYRIIE